MASRRDDESLRSVGGPGRSTASNSIRSRQESASINSSTTNVSLRRSQQTPADRSNHSMRPSEPSPHDERASDYLAKITAEVKEAQHNARQNERQNETQKETTGGRGRVQRLADESRNGKLKSSPKTPLLAYTRDDADSTLSSSLGVKAHSDKLGEAQQEIYDLKIKIHFLREKVERLEQSDQEKDTKISELYRALHAMEEIAEERDEAKAVNAKLIGEIEMRDEAIYQAAAKITDLEAQLEEAIGDTTTTPGGATFDTDAGGSESGEFADIKSSPPVVQTKPARSGNPTAAAVQNSYQYRNMMSESLVRMPSFLSDQDPDTGVLRAMFMPRDQSMMSLSMVNESEDGYEPFGERTLQSPRLSVISQSSLQSVYAPKAPNDHLYRQHDSQESLDNIGAPLDQTKRQYTRIELPKPSIKEWAGGVAKGGSFENVSARERKQRAQSTVEARKPTAIEKYVSNKDLAEGPPLSQSKLHSMLAKKQAPNGVVQRQRQRFTEARVSDSSPSFQAQVRNIKKADKRDAESFGAGRTLPPTPDTFSTNTLQHVNPSNETMNSTLDGTSTTLDSNTYQVRTVRKVPSFDDAKDKRRSRMGGQLFDLRPDPEFTNGKRLRRPRSYTDTITSYRRHGWDTPTQSETQTEQTVTETHSDFSSEATSKDAYESRPNAGSAAFNPPEMFNFASPEKEFDPRRDVWDISRDISTPAKWRTNTAMGHRHHSHLERTPTKGAYRQRSHSTFSTDTRRRSYIAPGTSNSPYRTPKAPERRSSLATTPISNEKRLRRLHENQESARADAVMSLSPLKPEPATNTINISHEPLLNAAQLQQLPTVPPLSSATTDAPKKGIFQRFNLRNVSNTLGMGATSKESKALEEERATPPPIMRHMSKAEKARRDARERHLRPHGLSSSPANRLEGMMERPATSQGNEAKRVVTFGGVDEQRFSQPGQSGRSNAGPDQDEVEESEDATTGGKKWGFSLGNRTFRRK